MDYKFMNIKELKTYKKVYNNTSKFNKESLHFQEDKKAPLTTQNAIKYLLEGTLRLRVCRYCLIVTSKLSELDEILTLAINGSFHDITIRDIIASFHPFKVSEDPNFPNKICSECVNRAISCYLFSQQCERAERALRNCFDDIHDKFEKLDPVEPVKKRGKRKLNPNYDTLYTEHKNVINYAEPIINIINIDSTSNNNSEISDLECPKCWQVLPNMELLLNHEKSHPKTMWYNCRLCGKSFVKRYHLRKHIKWEHKNDNETVDANDKHFQCNKCGTLCKTLGEHLQHIEKHKFKTLFNCLINRKVDSLCSICFDKSNHLSNLSEVVHLHGGYPGLTRDKRIEDILTATIPGQNPYKYRAFLVPYKATIIKLLKQKLHPDKIKSMPQVVEVSSPKNSNYSLASPSLKEENVFESIKALPFIFSKPYLLNPIHPMDNIMLIVTGDSKNDINDKMKYETEDTCLKEIQITASNKNIAIEVATSSCKRCWLFGKATCKSCLELIEKDSIIQVIDKKYVDVDEQRTNYEFCWIFEKIGRCSYCDKYFQNNEATVANIKGITYFSSQSDYKNNMVTLKTEKPSKILKEQVTITWQCHLCLTTNPKNRLTCLCCDETNNNQVNKKFNFGNSEIFYDGLQNKIPENNDNTTQSKLYTGNITGIRNKEQCYNKTIANLSEVAKPMEEDKIFELDIKVINVYNSAKHLNETIVSSINKEILPSKTVENSVLFEAGKKCIIEEAPMDIEIIPTYFNETREQSIKNDDHFEDMEITFEENNLTDSNTLIATSQYDYSSEPAKSSGSYIFHLGVGDSVVTKNRRMKKPLRRTAFYK